MSERQSHGVKMPQIHDAATLNKVAQSCKSDSWRLRSECVTSVAAAGNCDWLCNGQEVFPAMLSAIEAAKHSVCLESYIYAPGPLGLRFRDYLIRARQRQVRVQVLVDALGSFGLPADFWKP